MGFWGSLKAGVSETARLVDHGSKALLEAAEQVNHRSEIWVLKKTLERHVGEVDKKSILGESYVYFDTKKVEILKVIDEIVEKGDARDASEAISERNSISKKLDKYSLDSVIDRISKIEKEISKSNDLKPIVKKAKYDECVRLIERAEKYKAALDGEPTQEFIQKKTFFQRSSEESEKLRYEKKQELFSGSSRIRRVLSLRDGKLHGEQKEWYENGQLRIVAWFSDGRFNNDVKFFRDNGILAFEGTYDQSSEKAKGVLLMGDRVILRQEIIDKSGLGAADFWLWNGVKVARLKVVDFRVDRSFLFFKACIRPMVFVSLFKAWRRKEEYQKFSDMISAVEHWGSEISRFHSYYINR